MTLQANGRSQPLRCLFCTFQGTKAELIEHSAKCEKHPLWKKTVDEYGRGFRNAMAEVTISTNCDIRMYSGQPWADQIIAIIDKRDSLQADLSAAREEAQRYRDALEAYMEWQRARADLDLRFSDDVKGPTSVKETMPVQEAKLRFSMKLQAALAPAGGQEVGS